MADRIIVPEGYSCVRIVYSGGTVMVVEMIEKSTSIHYTGKIVQCLTQNDIDQFNREAGRLKTFDHPRIIKLKEVITINDIKVMVMELGGKPLSEIMKDFISRRVLMPRNEVYRVIEDISSALEMMHNHSSGRTAHGDIKIANILIGRDGHAKLCDFGVTESEEVSLTQLEMPQLYVSPERLESETGEATCEADVWALGVVLYWLLFGEPPFKAKKMLQLIRDIASFKAVSIPNSCGEEERALLMRMMDPCAESRITCRQLRLSKSFQCIVNTIDGVWKLKNDEQAQRVEAEDEKKKAETERARMEEEKKKAETERGKMEEEKQKAETEKARMEEEKNQAEAKRSWMEEEKKKAELERTRMEAEKKKAEEKAKSVEEEKERSEREKREMTEKIERMRVMMRAEWSGTDSLQIYDRTAHTLTPTTLTQIVKLKKANKWRTAFTLPIDEGEWELLIRGQDVFWTVMLGFVRHPLPEDATQFQCGAWNSGIGGHFSLENGGMWKGGEFKPQGTNKKCDRVGQTAAIRVNMSTREARLFVDDLEQPGIFPDIPSPLCLGISTHNQNAPVEVLHLARSDILMRIALTKQAQILSTKIKTLEDEKKKMEDTRRKTEEEKLKAETERAKMEEEKEKSEREKREMAEKMKQMRKMMGQEWTGEEALKTFNGAVHQVKDNVLTQIVKLDKITDWRTAFTFPIDEGEWELNIRGSDTIWNLSVLFSLFMFSALGYLKHPLPENATLFQCGSFFGGIGGHFLLSSGGMWQGGPFKLAGTNKKCDRVGQTAAIRVNMSTREARLFVDDSEQPGIFTDIPSPLCLGISTQNQHSHIQILHLARTDLLMNLKHANQQTLSMSSRMKTLEEEKKKAETESARMEEEKEKCQREMRKMLEKMKRMRMMLRTEWVGTESLHTIDRTVHSLTPTTLTQIIKLEKGDDWSSAFTFSIDEGEWELKIRRTEQTGQGVSVFVSLFIFSALGFLKHPLPEDATRNSCGSDSDGRGGDFVLYDGRMWKSGKEFKPAGTNKKCDRAGQTAALRVNMSTRTARLFVDDEAQPGIFTDIPSPLCLGISTYSKNLSVEVLHLARSDVLKRIALTKQTQIMSTKIKTLEDEKKKMEDTRRKREEEKLKAEMERTRMEEEKKKAESERARMEEEKGKAEAERAKMEVAKQQAERERARMEEENQKAEEMLKTIAEQKGQVEREKEGLSNEVKRTLQELEETRSEKEKSEREKREMAEKMKQMRKMMGQEWTGEEALKTFNGAVHQVKDNVLTQIVKLDKITDWRTAFTFPIDEGEWELNIRGSDTSWNVSVFFSLLIFSALGFLKHPLPENALRTCCGPYAGRIGGDFLLKSGGMWQGGQFKPAGTNKKCDRIGQTAAIRVNMRTREARLFVDDSEQPGIFTDIPSPLCLGISTHEKNTAIEVVHLARSDILMTLERANQQVHVLSAKIKSFDEEKKQIEEAKRKAEEAKKKSEAERAKMEEDKRKTEEKMRIAEEQKRQAEKEKEKLSDEVKKMGKALGEAREGKEKSEREKREMSEKINRMRTMVPTVWAGQDAFQTLDTTVHKFDVSTFTQIIKLEKDIEWRTAFTFPIDEGEWEFKIKTIEHPFLNVMLGFLRHPLPENAIRTCCGSHPNRIGGDFLLWKGSMWQGGEFKPIGTNKKCDRVGQTAAIRVSMSTREARLFVDDEEQPGIFTDVPSPLCLGITTQDSNKPIDILHLARTDHLKTGLESPSFSISARMSTLKDAKKKAETERARMEEAKKKAETERARMEEEKKKAETERARMEEEKKKAETERARMEEEKKKAETERARMEEAKKKAETERARMEEAKKKAETERARMEEEKKKAETERARMEEEKKKAETERAKMEEEKKNAETERARMEEAKKKAETERARMEEEKKKAETERARMEEEKKKAETERARMEEAKKKAETERARMEEAKKKAETERARMEEEKKKAETERARMEEEKKKAETERAKMEEEKKNAETERARMEEAKKKAETERARMEEEKKKAETERARMEEEKKKAETERARMEEAKKKAETERARMEEAKKKAETERARMEEEKKKAETERARMEEEKKKAETERARMEEEKKKAETERARMEEEKKKAETERARMEEEKKKAETERARMEEEKKNAETERARMEEAKKKAETERARMEEAKKKAETERARMEEEKKKAETERARMEEEKKKAETERARMEEEKKKAETERARMEEAKKKAETERARMEEEKKKAETERARMEEEKKNAETERRKMEEETLKLEVKMDLMKHLRTDWKGTDALQIYDRTSHTLTPTTLTQIVKIEKGWRTAFTFPINEGEWEFKIRGNDQSWTVMLGFIKHELPKDATQNTCGSYFGGIGGDFLLYSGGMWQGGEFKPAGTNKKCDRVGQTAAIRVNMSTREARLFVDDSEQPGIFTDIPSPLCLGISTAFQIENSSIDVLHLVRTDIRKTEQTNQILIQSPRMKTMEEERTKFLEMTRQQEEKYQTLLNNMRSVEAERTEWKERSSRAERELKQIQISMLQAEQQRCEELKIRLAREKAENDARLKKTDDLCRTKQDAPGTPNNAVLSELTDHEDNPRAAVKCESWLHVHRFITSAEDHDVVQIQRLLDLIINILNLACDDNIPLTNKRLLEQSLLKLHSTPSTSHRILQRAVLALSIFAYAENPPLMVVESTEFDAMNETILDLSQRLTELEHRHTEDVTRANLQTQQIDNPSERIKRLEKEGDLLREQVGIEQRRRERAEDEKMKADNERVKMEKEKKKAEEGKRLAEERQKKSEEQKVQAERENEKLSDEVKRTLQNLGEVREMKEKSERENREMAEKMKLRLVHLPIWVGTESLKTIDRTAHRLTPTTLTQIIKLEKDTEWRSAFTFPIDEGEWELKIRGNHTLWFMMLGFLRHPLPENATQFQCGSWKGGIGSDFSLWKGGMWKGREFKPAGTNKKCDRVGQTAAIRVNMSTREARLFVDDSEQPGIFTDIPSPLCLGITTHDQNAPIEVLYLATTDSLKTEHTKWTLSRSARINALEEEKLGAEGKMDRMRMMLRTEWVGTESLKTLDRTAHTLTPTTLTQIVALEKGWKTAFTFPIDEGEWELKIKRLEKIDSYVTIGFLRYPLPENATRIHCGLQISGIGGDFDLWKGGMWKGKQFKPAGTNKTCDRVGQTAAIRVNMSTREARLFVDDAEQPGIFPDIPSPLCLGITTHDQNKPIHVLHLARTDVLKTERDTQQAHVLSARITALEEEKKKADENTRKAEEMRGQAEKEKEKLSDEVKKTLQELGEARERKDVCEREKREMAEKMERMRMMMRAEWDGTESLTTIDRTAHTLTPTTLTQIVKLKTGEWRTAFTFPIDEGEWELKIRGNDTSWNVMLGFLRHPLPENATQNQCGYYYSGIGGHFIIWSGGMWHAGKEFKPTGTNKKCDRAGQTAVIRVNMSTREARLFVDDSEQPGIFTDIPSPLCLGISTAFQIENRSIDVLHLVRTDIRKTDHTNQTLIQSPRTKTLEEENTQLLERTRQQEDKYQTLLNNMRTVEAERAEWKERSSRAEMELKQTRALVMEEEQRRWEETNARLERETAENEARLKKTEDALRTLQAAPGQTTLAHLPSPVGKPPQ
ncbi:putative Salivary glue protein Sgs-4 [Blattamonas nauphoetae]|uniref:Salivary glue protein Sgs-4 n=1 Tax=Blattamonas nauphoetae TaxID=2049346 RepID=A0ABQ9XA15_9EUKA|nr:putative Salivary glue protein Sgs-4 [Blattamonas nauphoetae]